MNTSRPCRPLRTVLIGTSLEDESDQVVRAGLAVARAAGAQVHLVYAAHIEPQLAMLGAGVVDDVTRGLIAGFEGRLRQQSERLGIAAPELAGAQVLTGAPHHVLLEAAQTTGAGLIVLGATGAGPLAELLGSTADRVLRKARCPVLLVRGELRVPPQRVLAPVDLSPLSGDAFHCGLYVLSQVATDAAAKNAALEVRAVHALSFMEGLELQHRQPGLTREQVEHQVAEELRRFVLENRPEAQFPIETAILPGEARFEILHELSERPVDLVILGTHGRGGLDRLMIGSVASTVARKAPCSVLVISPEAALAEGIADAVAAQTTPAWHREPAHAD